MYCVRDTGAHMFMVVEEHRQTLTAIPLPTRYRQVRVCGGGEGGGIWGGGGG